MVGGLRDNISFLSFIIFDYFFSFITQGEDGLSCLLPWNPFQIIISAKQVNNVNLTRYGFVHNVYVID